MQYFLFWRILRFRISKYASNTFSCRISEFRSRAQMSYIMYLNQYKSVFRLNKSMNFPDVENLDDEILSQHYLPRKVLQRNDVYTFLQPDRDSMVDNEDTKRYIFKEVKI